MKIGKILNNNMVVVYEKNKPEKIIMRCGIAFHKKVGDLVDETKIDKIFSLVNPDTNLKLQQLLCEEISTKNIMLWDIKKFYKEEFQIGLHALKFIEEKFQMKLSEDEAGFIALHIVNAQMDNNYNAIKEIGAVTKLIHQIVKIVKYHFHTEFDEDSVYFYRFITHLKFFALRVFQKNIHQNEQDDELLSLVKNKYKSSYECTMKIKDYIEKAYSYTISEEEKLYLTIHIERIQKENSR